MNRPLKTYGSVMGLVLVFAAGAISGCGDQESERRFGLLSGSVQLEGSEDAAGVVVKVGSKTTSTAADGTYRFSSLQPAADAKVTAVKDGYKPGEKRVTIAAGQMAEADFELELTNHEPSIESLEVAEPVLKPKQEVRVTAEVKDEDDDELSYQWTATEGFTVTPVAGSPGAATVRAPEQLRLQGTITLRVTDAKGATDEMTTQVQTFDGYRPELGPVTATPSTLSPKETAYLSATATDKDGDDVTLSWSAPDDWTLSAEEGEQVELTAPDRYRASARITVVAEDETGLTAEESINVVTGENHKPVIQSIGSAPSQTTPGGSIELSVSAADSRGDSLSYKWTLLQADGWKIEDADKANAKVVAPDKYDQTAIASVEVSDSYGLKAKGELVISTVTNGGPQITSLTANPSTVKRGGSIELSVAAVDPNGDSLSYKWDAPQGWTMPTGTKSTSPKLDAPNKPGELATISVEVTDSSGKMARATTVVSTRPNNPPLVTSLVANPDKVKPGGKITVSASATDPDGDELIYKWDADKGWTVNGSGSEVEVTAPSKYDESGLVNLTVTDTFGSKTRVQLLVRTLRNAAPTVTSLVGTPNPVQRAGTMNLKVNATDPNGDTLTYKWSIDKPNSWTLTPNGDKAALKAPDKPSTTALVTVKADDGAGGVDTETLRVKTGTNRAPTITSVPPVANPTAGRFMWRYDVEGRDPDKDNLTYKVTGNAPNSLSINASTGVIEWWPTHADEGRFKFDVEVSDGFDTAVQTLQGTVQPFDFRDAGPATGTHTNGMVVADLNGDGRDDVATIDFSRGDLSVLLATKSGFEPAKKYAKSTNMQRCRGVAAGDIENDGDIDLVVGCQRSSWHPGYRIWKNDGKGKFSPGPHEFSKPYDRQVSMAAVELADLNGDKLVDLVLVAEDGSVTSWLNNKSGKFTYKDHVVSKADTRDAVLADLSGNGRPELVVAAHKPDDSAGFLHVWSIKADGSFDSKASYKSGKCFYHVTAGDYDADKDVDVAVADRCTGTLHTLKNDGNGTLAFHKNTSIGPANCISNHWSMSALGASDFDGDGHVDWAVGQSCNANGRFYLAFGDGKGGFAATATVKADKMSTHHTHALTAGDWDKDKRDDIYVWSNSSKDPVQVSY